MTKLESQPIRIRRFEDKSARYEQTEKKSLLRVQYSRFQVFRFGVWLSVCFFLTSSQRMPRLLSHIPLISLKKDMVSVSDSTSASISPGVLYRYRLALAVAGISRYRCSGCVQ